MKIPCEAGQKPCPFCTSTHAYLESNEETEKYWVTCAICAAMGPWAKSASSALSRWNERLGDRK